MLDDVVFDESDVTHDYDEIIGSSATRIRNKKEFDAYLPFIEAVVKEASGAKVYLSHTDDPDIYDRVYADELYAKPNISSYGRRVHVVLVFEAKYGNLDYELVEKAETNLQRYVDESNRKTDELNKELEDVERRLEERRRELEELSEMKDRLVTEKTEYEL